MSGFYVDPTAIIGSFNVTDADLVLSAVIDGAPSTSVVHSETVASVAPVAGPVQASSPWWILLIIGLGIVLLSDNGR